MTSTLLVNVELLVKNKSSTLAVVSVTRVGSCTPWSRNVSLNVEQLWTEFKDKIHSLMNEHIPTKLIRGNKNKNSWISKEVKSLIRKRNKQHNTF
jgi:hypothetical protein